MKKITVLFAVLAFSLFTASAFAADTLDEVKERGVLRVGTTPGYMPFEVVNKKGDIIGFDIDMAKRMAKSLGVKLEIVSSAWDGIIAGLITGKFDIIMAAMTITEERKQRIDFSDPYVVLGQTILVAKDKADIFKSYKDLNAPQYTVSSKLGTTGEFASKRMIDNAKYVAYETEQEAVMEVMNHKIDAFVYDMPFNAVAVYQMGNGKLVHLSTPFTEEVGGWAIRQNSPKFLAAINAFLKQSKENGVYDKLYKKWFEQDKWLKQLK